MVKTFQKKYYYYYILYLIVFSIFPSYLRHIENNNHYFRFAYGAHLYLTDWSARLTFEFHEAANPKGALIAFYDILKILQDEKEWQKEVNKTTLDCSVASLSCRIWESQSTARDISALCAQYTLMVRSSIITFIKILNSYIFIMIFMHGFCDNTQNLYIFLFFLSLIRDIRKEKILKIFITYY